MSMFVFNASHFYVEELRNFSWMNKSKRNMKTIESLWRKIILKFRQLRKQYFLNSAINNSSKMHVTEEWQRAEKNTGP